MLRVISTFDPLRLLITVAVGGVIFTAGALAFIYSNRGSDTIVVYTLGIVGGMILLIVQTGFDLQVWEKFDRFAVEYTLTNNPFQIENSSGHAVAGPPPTPNISAQSQRADLDRDVNRLLASLPHLHANVDRISEDFTLLAFLTYFSRRHFDWQLQSSLIRTSSLLALEHLQGQSDVSECKIFTDQDLRAILRTAGNVLADLPQLTTTGKLCLPKDSTISIEPRQIVIDGPFARTSLSIQGIPLRESGVGNDERPTNIGRKAERIVLELRLLVRLKRWRSIHNDAPKYRAWLDEVREGALSWFQ